MSAAATRKPNAPNRVPKLSIPGEINVAGSNASAATAEAANMMEPNMFAQTAEVSRRSPMWLGSGPGTTNARALDSRKRVEPTASGTHTLAS